MARGRQPRTTGARRVREALSEAQNHRCAYCGEDVRERPTVDHVLPTSQGGKPNSWDNLVIACYDCNQRRGNMDAYKFFSMVRVQRTIADELAALVNLFEGKDTP